jgi:DNA-binding transcriptional MerR regulator
MAVGKAEGALKTISEVSEQFGIAQHILRYWETRFPQLRPLQRAGNRRYYRPADIALIARIDTLLNREGYTIRGVQKLLSRRGGSAEAPAAEPAASSTARASMIVELQALRAQLANALARS